jgi:hypothetical protein
MVSWVNGEAIGQYVVGERHTVKAKADIFIPTVEKGKGEQKLKGAGKVGVETVM